MSDQIEQYKAVLQDRGNIASGHRTARSFYISVVTALLAVLALADKNKILSGMGKELLRIVGIAGMAISMLWLFQTLSLDALYRAGFRTLEAMEERLPFQTFKAQYAQLKSDWRYFPVTYIECGVAAVFFLLFSMVMLMQSS